MQRNIIISLGEPYHIYNRGVDKRFIFKDKKDKERFIKLLYMCNNNSKINFKDFQDKNISEIKISKRIVALGAYCLMDNHFHLILKETTEGGITKFMSKLSTAYAMYFNNRNKRTGTLFENRFKAKHCACDTYFKYLYAYIHLNPLKFLDPEWKENGIKNITVAKDFLKKYKYSSFQEFFSPKEKRCENFILQKGVFPDYFKDSSFEKYIDFWMKYKDICTFFCIVYLSVIIPFLNLTAEVCPIDSICG